MTGCIAKFPALSFVVRNTNTDAAFFERVPDINLNEHISIVADGDIGPLTSEEGEVDDLSKIEQLLPSIADHRWSMSTPPWKVIVLPLRYPGLHGKAATRCFVVYSFSHALGDAISALAFHRTFREGLCHQPQKEGSVVATSMVGFPLPFDTAETLPISWSFLLRPLIAVLLPKFIAQKLGLRSSASTITPDTWTGTKMFFDPLSFRTCIKLTEIQGSKVDDLLQVARKNGAKITGMLHQSLVRALSKEIPRSTAKNFVSATAVNMRRAIGKTDDEMGLFVNAWYDSYDRDDAWATPWSEKAWENARSLTEKLAGCAVTLEDQAVGLLRYVPSIKKWTAAKMGQERDSSYEISNLGAFDAASSAVDNCCSITKLVFSHSANATSSPFTLSVVSIKGGSMVISVAWQPGALGVPLEEEEAFIERVSKFVRDDLEQLK
jgi:hypothetical protein